MSAPAVPARLRTFVVASLLFFGTALLFARTFGNDFINFDDPDYVANNLHVQSGLSSSGLVWVFTLEKHLDRINADEHR